MYAKLNNGVIEKYPYTISQLRKDNPQCSFPKIITQGVLDQFNLVIVQAVTAPTVTDPTKRVVEDVPEFIDGMWYQKYNVVTLSSEEYAEREQAEAEFIRGARNQKLTESDWTQVADSPVDLVSWGIYRQALRDVPAQEGFPWDVTWPERP
jgi:hypothetical protein